MKKILILLILLITSSAYAARIDIEAKKEADPSGYTVGDSFVDIDTMTLEIYNTNSSQDSSISSNASGIATLETEVDSKVENIIAGTNVTVSRTGNDVTVNSSGGGGSSVWGFITGLLSDQTDLQNELDGKVNTNPDSIAFNPITEPTHEEGNVYYDSDAKTLSVQNDITGSSLQLGRENWSRSCNNTGVTLSNGSVVYISGIDTDCPEVTLAQPDEFVKSRIIGVVTNNIANGAQGEVTSYGRVRDINTSALTAGMPCYLDTDGAMTSTSPTGSDYTVIVGVCLVSNATTGSIFVNPYVSEVTVDVTDTNGFPNRTETAISFNDTTRTFSIAPTDTAFYYYIDGKSVKRTTTDNIIIDNSEGLHVIYYDDNAGTLATVLNPTPAQQDVVIRTKVIISYVYWDAENSKSIYLPDERHGISMSPQTHSYLHFTQGAKYLSGLALTDVLSDQTGDVNTHAQFGILTGVIVDEDIVTVAPTVLSTVGLPIYYLDSANVYSRLTTNSGFSVLDDITAGVGATGRLVYNEWTGTTWQLSTVGNNDFVLCHIFATNDSISSRRNIAVIGQGDYGTIGQARAGATTEISNILTRFPQEEFVPVATVIFQTSDGYSNDVKARIRTDDEGADYVDWRTTELAQGVTPSDHNNLTGLELATDGTTWGHIDDQAQTIYGDKTFDGNTTIGPLTNLIFSDGSETVTTDPFSFSANHGLRLVDDDMAIPSEDLIDASGLLEDGIIEADKLEATNSPADGQVPSYDSATGGFTFVNNAGGTGDLAYSEVTTDPTSSSTADTFYGNTSDGGFFFKSDTGIFDIVAGTYTADPAPAPTLTSATIPSAGTTVSLLFSEAITIGAGGNGGWTLNTPTNAMTYSSGDTTNNLIYTLASTINSTDTPTITYTQPGNGLENSSGTDLESIVAGVVTNNSTAGGSTATVLDVQFEGATESDRLENLVDSSSPTATGGATTDTTSCGGTRSYDTTGSSTGLVYSISNFDPEDYEISFCFNMPTFAVGDFVFYIRVDASNYIYFLTNGTGLIVSHNAGGTIETLNSTTAINDSAWHTVSLRADAGTLSLYIDGNLDDSEAIVGTWAGTVTECFWGIEYDGTSTYDGYLDDLIISTAP